MTFRFQQIRVKDNFSTVIVYIIVFCCDFINLDCTESGNRNNVSVNNRISGNFFTVCLVDPFQEDFAGYERILRHLADRFSFTAEVLGKSFRYFAGLFINDNEFDFELIVESGFKDKIGINGFSTCIFSSLRGKPANEIFPFHNRSRGKRKGISFIVAILVIDSILNHEDYGKDVLFVFYPDVQISGRLVSYCTNIDPVGEFFAIGIVPGAFIGVAGISIFLRNSRDVVQTVAGP